MAIARFCINIAKFSNMVKVQLSLWLSLNVIVNGGCEWQQRKFQCMFSTFNLFAIDIEWRFRFKTMLTIHNIGLKLWIDVTLKASWCDCLGNML